MTANPSADRDAQITDEFHRRYYDNPYRTWSNTTWMGCPALKCPLDLWVYQEIIFETKPDLIIETGTYKGGSALYLANVLDALALVAPDGREPRRVISIDIEEQDRPSHRRVHFVTGSSVAPETRTTIESTLSKFETPRVMVILDSDHAKDHVSAELETYAPFVTPGCYLIVEDTNVNGNPIYEDFGPGPMEAVIGFLETHDEFTQDRDREKYYMTFNPGGYLRRR